MVFVQCWTKNRYRVLTERCVCYVLEDYSVTVDWVAQWIILYKRPKEARVSNSSQTWLSSSVVYPSQMNNRSLGFKSHWSSSLVFFFWNAFFWNSSPHNSQALSKTHQRIGRHPSFIMLKWWAPRPTGLERYFGSFLWKGCPHFALSYHGYATPSRTKDITCTATSVGRLTRLVYRIRCSAASLHASPFKVTTKQQ